MSSSGLKRVDTRLLAELSARALDHPRRRTNNNLHGALDEPVQRLLNALAPGTFVRPHRHAGERARWELMIALSGRLAVLCFDDAGRVSERVELDADGALRAVEVPAGTWHGLAVLAPGSVILEVKPGPYVPAVAGDFAAWAPADGEAAAAFVRFCETAGVGDGFIG